MKVFVEFDIDWEGYDDVVDELVWNDLWENNFVGMDGVTPKLIKIERDYKPTLPETIVE